MRRLGTIIQSIFCAQSGAGICLNFGKYFGESRYPGALLPALKNLRPAFSPDPTDCLWVSEDGLILAPTQNGSSKLESKKSCLKKVLMSVTRVSIRERGK